MTIGLKSVENPLEFGIVVTDEDGRVERFLEKPSWGQVFSDTINTGIYVIEPEVLKHIPQDRPYDFSKELFPLLLEMGRPIYGHVFDGYWQDIGNLDQYRQANFDALDERVQLEIPGIRIRGNVWLGDGVDLDDLDAIEGPAYLGNYCRIARGARVGPYSVLATSVTVRERGRVVRSIVDASTYIGRSTELEGAIVGRSCDLRAHVRVHQGVAIGDEVTIGAESVILPDVRIYPFKEVETGSQLHESLIWESRGTTRVFGKQGVAGMVNVDLTPDVAVRLAAALGTALKRGARVVASRESPAACRMIKRAMISGISSTGVNVGDLRISPAAVARHLVKSEAYEAGFHVGVSPTDPEVIRIQFFEQPGIEMSAAMQKEVEKHFTRGEFRRVAAGEVGGISYPARVRETYATRAAVARSTPTRCASAASGSSWTTVSPAPRTCSRSCSAPSEWRSSPRTRSRAMGPTRPTPRRGSRPRSARRNGLCPRSGRISARSSTVRRSVCHLVDEQAHEVPVEQALLLFLRLLGSNGRHGKLAFPVTVTSQVDRLVEDPQFEVVRTPTSGRADVRRRRGGRRLRGGGRRRLRLPGVPAGYDAVASLAKLLELLAPVEPAALGAGGRAAGADPRPLPGAVPLGAKGLVMRVLTSA